MPDYEVELTRTLTLTTTRTVHADNAHAATRAAIDLEYRKALRWTINGKAETWDEENDRITAGEVTEIRYDNA